MDKILMTTPLVEMDGDEMTRILWSMIKEELLLPFIDLKTEYYDLGLEHRNETNDQCHEKIRRCRKMRDNHPKRGPHGRISFKRNVEKPKRHDPRYVRRNCIPRADYCQRH
jgi:hypothetical protein